MKKFLKIIVLIIVILAVLLVINTIRNYTILKKIYNLNKELEASLENWYYECTIDNTNAINRTSKSVVYNYGNIYVSKEYANDVLLSTTWINTDTGESLQLIYDSYGNFADYVENDADSTSYNTSYQVALLSSLIDGNSENAYAKILMQNLFNPIKKENGCYAFNWNNTINATVYVDSDTGIIRKEKVHNGISSNSCELVLKNNATLQTEVEKPEIPSTEEEN